jgi:hypothetical protein
MAPEMALGGETVLMAARNSTRFGCVAYYLLTGDKPCTDAENTFPDGLQSILHPQAVSAVGGAGGVENSRGAPRGLWLARLAKESRQGDTGDSARFLSLNILALKSPARETEEAQAEILVGYTAPVASDGITQNGPRDLRGRSIRCIADGLAFPPRLLRNNRHTTADPETRRGLVGLLRLVSPP